MSHPWMSNRNLYPHRTPAARLTIHAYQRKGGSEQAPLRSASRCSPGIPLAPAQPTTHSRTRRRTTCSPTDHTAPLAENALRHQPTASGAHEATGLSAAAETRSFWPQEEVHAWTPQAGELPPSPRPRQQLLSPLSAALTPTPSTPTRCRNEPEAPQGSAATPESAEPAIPPHPQELSATIRWSRSQELLRARKAPPIKAAVAPIPTTPLICLP